MSELLFRPAAERDLEEIWRYSAERWGMEQADRYIHDLFRACQRLAAGETPHISAEHVRAGYLALHVGRHVVYCTESTDSLVIVRILHQRMDVARHLD